VIGLYALVIFVVGVIFVFDNGIAFALRFFGTAMVPAVAIVGMKWGLVKGDAQQKVGVPLIALALLAFAYWLSTGVSVQIGGYHLNGWAVGLIGVFVGLASSTSWAD
jgi:hypothetical protein